MWKFILPPAATSIATQSSVATLPVNLDAARNIGVPKDIREIVLPLGATMHMDGTIFSTLLKIAFLFGIFGKPFTGFGTFASAMLIAIMSGVVMSGVPGGGLIGEMLIVSLYGFPAEAFPIIATIGFLVDPPGTCINATGDTIAAMMVSKLVEGKDWLKMNLTKDEGVTLIKGDNMDNKFNRERWHYPGTGPVYVPGYGNHRTDSAVCLRRNEHLSAEQDRSRDGY